MKKVACIILSILLLIGCMGCAAVISHPSGTAVQICYNRENIFFDLELSQEEANVVLSVLNGKKRDLDKTVTGAGCGFGREQAFIINGSTYCLAQDGCDCIWEEGTNNYYVLPTQEMNPLREIFNAHGGNLPLQKGSSVDEATAWDWAQGLNPKDITSATPWSQDKTFEALDGAERRELVRLLNKLTKDSFTENENLTGGTPLFGIEIVIGSATYHINEYNGPNGRLEMVMYNEKQWIIDNDDLFTFIQEITGNVISG